MVAKKKMWILLLPALGVAAGGLSVGQWGNGIRAQGTAPPAGQSQVAGPEERASDRAAIREALKDFVAAFERGDAAAAAAHMTTGAEMMAPDGTTVHGRDAVQKAYADL